MSNNNIAPALDHDADAQDRLAASAMFIVTTNLSTTVVVRGMMTTIGVVMTIRLAAMLMPRLLLL